MKKKDSFSFRVKWSKEGLGTFWPGNKEVRGTAWPCRDPDRLLVQWDGNKTASRYHKDFIQRVDK